MYEGEDSELETSNSAYISTFIFLKSNNAKLSM